MMLLSLWRVLLTSLVLVVTAVVQTSGYSFPLVQVPQLQSTRFTAASKSDRILSTDVVVANRGEFAYMIQVKIGGQNFPVILDTGSSDLWIVSTDCVSSDCDGVPRYNSSSTSLKVSSLPFQLSYLLGSVSGKIAFETITVGPYEVSSQIFALADRTVGLGLSSTGNSGILGLSFPSEAAIPLTSGLTLLQNLFTAFPEPDRYFAFKLGRAPRKSSQNTNASEFVSSFTIGELDSAIVNNASGFVYLDVSGASGSTYDYWKLPMQSITINSVPLPLSPSLVPAALSPIAVLDTGTTLILGPTIDVDAFWDAVGLQGQAARKNNDTGLWDVRCERGVHVGFVLGSKGSEREFMLDPGDVSWEEGGSEGGWCMGGIQANDGVNSGDWLLGGVFLRNVYVTHHSATTVHPPVIGLLNLTNPTTSLSQFQNERGSDPFAESRPSIKKRSTANNANVLKMSGAIVHAIAAICGFVSGSVVIVVVRTKRTEMRERRKERL